MTAGQLIRRVLAALSETSSHWVVCGVLMPDEEFSDPRAATWLRW